MESTIRHRRHNQAGSSKSGAPVRATMDGLEVVTLALSYDAEALEKKALMLPGWRKPSPQNSPYTSTIVF
jgi:sulfate/thiosulfate transport system substrate-binding protein